MIHSYPVFYIARFVLETCTPLSISSGLTGGSMFDNLLIRDANGLPAIPGSSLAGVLRHLYRQQYGEETVLRLFGDAKKEKAENKKDAGKDRPSVVHISWGCLHNGNNVPVEGMLDPEALDALAQSDPLIADARQNVPVKRDHVRLNKRGAADDETQGKFERISLTTGHRFSVECVLWSDSEKDERWDNLTGLLTRADFRLGGGARRGLGKLKIIRFHSAVFDLRKKDKFAVYRRLGSSLGCTKSLQENPIPKSRLFSSFKIRIYSEDGYRFGGGSSPWAKDTQADLVPVFEPIVIWKNGEGKPRDRCLVAPASGIKGALRHRTLFHYRALGIGREDPDSHSKSESQISECAVDRLFGYVDDNKIPTAKAGLLLFDDTYLIAHHPVSTEIAHTSIDRFTGGVRDGMLFFEEMIGHKDPLEFEITLLMESITPPDSVFSSTPDREIPWKDILSDEFQDLTQALKALEYALNDLIEGRLAFGGGSGRVSTGYFSGGWELSNTRQSASGEHDAP